MADIQKLTYPYFTDGTTPLNASNLNQIVAKINEVIDKVNGGVTPTQTVATPSISVNNGVVTITCSTAGASIRYTTDGSIPTSSSGTVYSAAFTPASGTTTIKAIAYKTGMTNSSVATQSYQGEEPETAQILARYTKSVTNAQKDALNTFVVALKTAGIYSKIDYLMLPFLAASAAEATQDALGNGNGTFNNSASVTLANNAISPLIGGDVASISGLSDLTNTNVHFSYYSVDAPTLASAKWDVAIGLPPSFPAVGKYINNSGIGANYIGADGESTNKRWTPDGVSSYNNTAKTHIITVGTSGKVAISVNGTYVEDDSLTGAKSTTAPTEARLFLSAGASATTYLAPADATTLSKASEFKYGLFSIGKALTQAECTAFNSAVNTLMNAIFS